MMDTETKQKLVELGFKETQFFPAVYIKNDIVILELTDPCDRCQNIIKSEDNKNMRVMENDDMLKLLAKYENYIALNMHMQMKELNSQLDKM